MNHVPSRVIPDDIQTPDEKAVYLLQHLSTHAAVSLKNKYQLSREDLDDIFGDTFEKILGQCRAGHGPDKAPIAWAEKILVNAIIDHRRHQDVRRKNSAAVTDLLRRELDSRRLAVPDEVPNDNAALARATSGLRLRFPNQARALTLRGLGSSLPEVAKAMGIKLSSAKQLVSRGMKHIKDHLRTEALMYTRQGKDLELVAAELGIPVSFVLRDLLQNEDQDSAEQTPKPSAANS